MRIVDKIGEMLSLSSISLKLLVVLGLLVVVPLLVLGILLIETNQQAIEKTVSENHQKIAVLLAEEIDRFVSTPSQILMTAAQLVGPTGIDFWKQHNILATLALNHPVLERVAFLDTQGMEISSSDLVPQLTHRAGDLAFLRASSGDLYRSELYVSDNDLPFMRVSLPVRYAGQIAGVLLAEVNLRGIWDRVDNIPIGETGSISVVTQEGWIIAHRDKKKVIRGETLALPGLTDRTAGTTALKEREGSGEAWLYTHAFISSLGWNVIVQQSVKEAHASSREMALRSWVLILFSLAATLAVAFALARWIVRPILRLIQGTRRIASGDLSHRIDTRRRDEIGALASSFNEMAASLKQTRDSLQASTTNLVAIFNGITDMLSMIDLGHNIVRANRTVQNVYRMAEKELVGRTISAIEVLQPKCLNVFEAGFQGALTGAQIITVTPRGKWLQVETTRGWLVLNLGMGGEILLTSRDNLPEKYRIIFDLADGAALVVNFWWFGQAHHVTDLADHAMTAGLGPNPLDLTLDEFRELLRGRRGGIKSFLLNQKRIAGIGNVYAQDPLFKARIHPLRSINTLSDEEIGALWQALCETLHQSIDHGGSHWEQNLYGEHGRWDSSFFLIAYREGQPCPNCGTPVERSRLAARARTSARTASR